MGRGDILPEPPRAWGSWSSINFGHRLIPISSQLILDWEPATGDYRIWRYDRNIQGEADPLPGPPVYQGNWSTIRSGHKLVPIGNHILDWEPSSGDYRVWRYDPSVPKPDGDPFVGPAARGSWSTISGSHELIYMGTNRVLDWVPGNGSYRVWRYDEAGFPGDPLPGPPIQEGDWYTIRTRHRLINCLPGSILDWEPFSGHYRRWKYDPTPTIADIFIDPPLADGFWHAIRGTTYNGVYSGAELVFLYPDRMLVWWPSKGDYKIYPIDPNATGYVSVQIKNECRDRRDQVKEAAYRAYESLDATVTDVTLRECIKRGIANQTIICGEAGTFFSPAGCDSGIFGRNKWSIFGRSKDIHICVQNIADKYPDQEAFINRLSKTIIHEFAHSCGWGHGDGKGVPENTVDDTTPLERMVKILIDIFNRYFRKG